MTVVYISHKLDEIFELGDAVTVLRDGRHIATKPLSEVAGRLGAHRDDDRPHACFHGYEPRTTASDARIVLTADGPHATICSGMSRSISTRGEVVGFYGLVGAGKTEDRPGALRRRQAVRRVDPLQGAAASAGRPRTPSPSGIALVPEERRTQGLFTPLTIRRNIPVMNMRRLSRRGVIRSSDERAVAVEYVEKLQDRHGLDRQVGRQAVRREPAEGRARRSACSRTQTCCCSMSRRVASTSAPRQRSTTSSGAWPTTGTSVAVFSSELEEVLGICDRIFLLFAGSLVATVRNGPDVDTRADHGRGDRRRRPARGPSP